MFLRVDFPGYVRSLCLNRSGTLLALANESDPGEVLVVDVPDGKEVARYSNLASRPKITFRSETELVLVHGTNVWLCDTATNTQRVLQLDGEHERCSVAPDGQTIVFGGGIDSGGLLVLDIAETQPPRNYRASVSSWVEGINHSPAGQLLAAQCVPRDYYDRSMRFVAVFDAQSGEEVLLLKLPWYQFYIYPTAFRPDACVLAVCCHSNILLYDVFPPKSPLDPDTLFGEVDPILAMGWSRPTACHRLAGRKQVANLRYSADGNSLKVCCEDGTVLDMSAKDGRILREIPPPEAAQGKIRDMVFSHGGTAVGVAGDSTLFTWNTADA